MKLERETPGAFLDFSNALVWQPPVCAPHIWKSPGERTFAKISFTNGCECWIVIVNSYGSGSTSKTPNPPRIRVLPPRGFQAKPRRGSKFRSVGFLNSGGPTTAVASER